MKTLYIKNFCLFSENRRLPSNHYPAKGGSSRPQIAIPVLRYGIQLKERKAHILAWNPVTFPKSSFKMHLRRNKFLKVPLVCKHSFFSKSVNNFKIACINKVKQKAGNGKHTLKAKPEWVLLYFSAV